MKIHKHDYLQPTNQTKAQIKSWRVGGLKFMLGLLIREFGGKKVKDSVDEIMTDSEEKYILI